jgi:hypothetical protein
MGISRLDKELLASQKGLCSVELIGTKMRVEFGVLGFTACYLVRQFVCLSYRKNISWRVKTAGA